jgi:hypothetical protein
MEKNRDVTHNEFRRKGKPIYYKKREQILKEDDELLLLELEVVKVDDNIDNTINK